MFGARLEFALLADPLSCTYEGGKSSSSTASTSATSTTNIDKRQVTDSGAVGVSADSSNVYVTNVQTDQGALAIAGGIAGAGLQAGFGITENALRANYGVTEAALLTAQNAMLNSLWSGERTAQHAMTSTERTAENAIDLSRSSTSAMGSSLRDVLGFAGDALSNAFTLTRDNIRLQTTSAAQIGDAYKTAGDITTGNRALATTGLVIAGIVATGVVLIVFVKSGNGKSAAIL